MTKKGICWLCGKERELTTHHAIPVVFNPVNNKTVPLCRECHDDVNAYAFKCSKQRCPECLRRKYITQLQRLNDCYEYEKKRRIELENHKLEE
jgi:hypothetical protein